MTGTPVVHRHLCQLSPVALQPVLSGQVKGTLHELPTGAAFCRCGPAFILSDLNDALVQRHIPAHVTSLRHCKLEQ